MDLPGDLPVWEWAGKENHRNSSSSHLISNLSDTSSG